jgi:hypothetical protein
MGIACLLFCLLIEEEVVQESPKKFAYLQLVVQTVENGEVSSIVFFRCHHSSFGNPRFCSNPNQQLLLLLQHLLRVED